MCIRDRHTPSGISIGAGGGSANEVFNGRIAILNWYDRRLSATEVLQNYNAHKGRYGL